MGILITEKLKINKNYRKTLLTAAILGPILAFVLLWWLNNHSCCGENENLYYALESFLLWEAGIAALWAAKETFDQKNIANKTLVEVRKQYDYEMRPFLRLQWSTAGATIFDIANEGKGIAIDVVFEPVAFKDQNFESVFTIKSRPAIAPNGPTSVSRDELLENYIGVLGKDSSIKGYIERKIRDHFCIKVVYKDLENHHYEAIFISDDSYNDRFRIDHQYRLD